jgi:hypothetical protein
MTTGMVLLDKSEFDLQQQKSAASKIEAAEKETLLDCK